MQLLSVPVSVGELLDKVTILRIKKVKITDAAKLANIGKELGLLEQLCGQNKIDLDLPLIDDLFQINMRLWQVEDDIRDKDLRKEFDAQFIDLARQVYRLNDQRFAVKSKLNTHFGSALREEKSYRQF